MKQPQAGLPDLENNSVYISELSYENTEANRDKILDLLRQQFQVTARPDENRGVGEPYFIGPAN